VITAWRIVKAKYDATAFEGRGARRAGGRWNSRGKAIVYTAESAALAALELLVHLGRSRTLPDYVIFSCTFPESLVQRIRPEELPPDWRSHPGPGALRRIGDEWFERHRSAVLQVPSAVIDTENNYLLNPEHRAYGRIVISTQQPFELDLRLLRR
jgi:RES domain-containing protein